MQQISPPLRFALIGLVLLGAVWFIALRPKSSKATSPRPSPHPGVQGLANSVAKARSAKEAADASVARTEQAVANADGSSTASAKSATGTTTSKTSPQGEPRSRGPVGARQRA